MDIRIEQFELTAAETWFENELLGQDDSIDDDHLWFSMPRIGYDIDSPGTTGRPDHEPEFRWFG